MSFKVLVRSTPSLVFFVLLPFCPSQLIGSSVMGGPQARSILKGGYSHGTVSSHEARNRLLAQKHEGEETNRRGKKKHSTWDRPPERCCCFGNNNTCGEPLNGLLCEPCCANLFSAYYVRASAYCAALLCESLKAYYLRASA